MYQYIMGKLCADYCILYNSDMGSKFIRIGSYIALAFCLGLGSAIFTNNYIGRPYPNGYWTDCVKTIHDGIDKQECSKKLESTKGWPFPSINVYSDGSKSAIRTDTTGYCIGGCDTTTIGGQFIYNALLFAFVYFMIFVVILKVKKRNL